MTLCYRCEHRARFLETGARPRCECGDTGQSKYSCYMYKPVCPVILTPSDPSDPRPWLGPPMISSRSKAVRVAEAEMECATYVTPTTNPDEDHVIVYWRPKK